MREKYFLLPPTDQRGGGKRNNCIFFTILLFDTTLMDEKKVGSFDRPFLKETSRRLFRKIRPLPPSSESPLKCESASYFSPANYAINLDSCGEYSLRTWSTFDHWKKKKLRRFFNPTAQITNARSIHRAFFQWRMIDDNKKIVHPHLAIVNDFFPTAFVNPCMM